MGWRRGQAYGPGPRVRVLAACDSGASVREVAKRLMVSPSNVVKVRHRRTRHRGLARVSAVFSLAVTAYNLVRLPKLLGANA